MRKRIIIISLLFAVGLALLSGCALGRKDWPSATESEDRFSLRVVEGVRQDNCLLLTVTVKGASNRLLRASILYESVGDGEGQGCSGCPFVPREAVHFTRGQDGFDLQNGILSLSLCGLNPGVEYRFRVSGKNELPSMPMTYSEVWTSAP